MLDITRHFPHIPLPRKRFLPGQGLQHPKHDWIAHFGDARLLLHATQVDENGTTAAFRYGIDCYNAGFYWEAHEFWEPLWQAERETQPQLGAALKALIQFAAANVQLLCGRQASWLRLGQRAEATARAGNVDATLLLGIDWRVWLGQWQLAWQAETPQPIGIVQVIP